MEQAGTYAAGLAGGVGASAASAQPQPELPPTGELVPGYMVGEYRIDKKIGEGGMGAVYSATHPMIGKRAAIKVISAALGTEASAVGRFVQEARSVNQIGHPNIVDVFAFGELPDGRNYFVMEYLQGEGFADRIHRAAMPLGEAIAILDQVADALEAAHEKQIVHRDLKPDNVYLASVRGGRTLVKLLDFGIAKLSTPDSSGSGGGIAKTRTGMMMGTPGYLSPEQARGKNVDHRTDIYALGCMTFEIACGRLPFVADNAMDIVLAHMTEPAPRPSSVWPEIPPPLDELIARMLEKDPSLRPTLAEVRAVFADLVTSGLVTLTGGQTFAFGSGISRGAETPRPISPPTALAAGTQPATPAPATFPPSTVEVTPKKKTGLVVGVLAGVVLIGGAGAFFAMKGGSETKPVAAEQPAAQPQQATPAPAPAPAPVEAAQPAAAPAPAEAAPAAPAAPVEASAATLETKPVETSRTNAKVDRAKTGAKAGSKGTTSSATNTAGAKAGATTSTSTTTTTSGSKTDGKKGPDVNKDAPVDPFQ